MKFAKLASAVGALALIGGAGTARADVVNFDELISPPVTCCYGNPVVGPLNYAHVTIQDGAGAGQVMNGDGWQNKQTSGFNLFGTLEGEIDFLFNTDASGLAFDIINGTSPDAFTVHLFDGGNNEVAVHTINLDSFGSAGSVGHLAFGLGGIRAAVIFGNGDFAVDTISFNQSAVPEPAGWALMISGFGLAGAALRRRRAVALAA